MCERSKRANPASLEVQPECVVKRVPSFVPQDAHALDFGAALDFPHEFALELHQPRMGQVKGNRKPRHTIGCKPFGGQPHVRLEADAAIVQLTVKPTDVWLDEGPFDMDGEIANASVE